MEIRSGGMYAARSIFAEQSLPCGSKNAYLADLPPGSPKWDERQIRPGGSAGGSQDPIAVTIQSMTEWLRHRPFSQQPFQIASEAFPLSAFGHGG